MRPFRFGLIAPTPENLPDRTSWRNLARRVEERGFSTLLIGDHLGTPSPFPALVSAADATNRLRVGTLVANNDFYHPLRLAQDVASTDVLTGGRFEFGVGSGWAKPEYDLLGVDYEKPPVRAERLRAALRTMTAAWAGETAFDLSGTAVPAVPAPVQRPHPPLLIGGHGDAILTLAAEHADIVGLGGLRWERGALRPRGFAAETIEERIAFVRDRAGARFDDLEFNALVQLVIVTSDAARVRAEAARRWELSAETVAASPFVMVGSHAELADKIRGLRERLGISYYAFFVTALDDIAPVVAELANC